MTRGGWAGQRPGPIQVRGGESTPQVESDSPQQAGKRRKRRSYGVKTNPQPATPAPLQTFSWEGQALRLNPPARPPSPFPPASSQEGPTPALLPACTPQVAYGRTLFLIRVVIKGETLTAHFHDDVQNLAFLGVREERRRSWFSCGAPWGGG